MLAAVSFKKADGLVKRWTLGIQRYIVHSSLKEFLNFTMLY